jgi:hypothetical protein
MRIKRGVWQFPDFAGEDVRVQRHAVQEVNVDVRQFAALSSR